ncbi:MAG: hypothetical protein ACMXYA_00610 [Candidatus Woesearchaeota archaeon]
MVNQYLVEYLEENLQKGHTLHDLEVFLEEAGYSTEQINEAYQFIQTKSPHINSYKIFGGIFIMIITGVLVFIVFFADPQQIQTDPVQHVVLNDSGTDESQLQEQREIPLVRDFFSGEKISLSPVESYIVVEDILREQPDMAEEFCNQLIDPQNAFHCYKEVVLYFEDPAICEKITLSVSRDDCYFRFADDQKLDRWVCANIRRPVLRSACQNMYNVRDS